MQKLIHFLVAFIATTAIAQTPLYTEPLRPQFHFTAKKNWLNDPNGMVCFAGTYHFFFQYNPFGTQSANKSWGYATSKDLVHWTERDPVLFPDNLGEMWSGSGVVDKSNTTGFGDGKLPPLVLIYTAAGGTNKESAGKSFTQCLAYSTDAGQSWQKYKSNPVIPHIRGGNRDPKVIWHAPTRHWIMALYLDQNDFAFYSSPDLKTWTHEQTITVPDCAECPDFWEMPIEKEPGKTAWIWTNANTKYLVGQFDGHHFTPDNGFTPIQNEFGKNFYAAQTFSNSADGRRIQIAWMRDGQYPGMPFNQQMSFPCTLTLHRTHAGLRLHRNPVDEIKSLHDAKLTKGNESVDHDLPLGPTTGDVFDINLVIDLNRATHAGLRVGGQSLVFDTDRNQLGLGHVTAPLTPINGRITLRVLVDRTSIEVFANDGEISISNCYLPARDADSVPPTLFVQRPATLISSEIFTMKSAWPAPPAVKETKP